MLGMWKDVVVCVDVGVPLGNGVLTWYEMR
jgi:hypothetical protein